MTTYFVDLTNWNSAAFWAGINESTSGHQLTFSQLPSNFTVDILPDENRILIDDGTTVFTIGDANFSGTADATLGGTTLLEFFIDTVGSQGSDFIDGTDDGNFIFADAGDDTINAGQGDDFLFGSTGNDIIFGDGLDFDPSNFASTGGSPATLNVTNSADGPVELWWIDFSGTLVFYQTIQPGQTNPQSTDTNHNWVLRDEDGKLLELILGGNQTVNYGAGGLADDIYGGGGNDTLNGMFGDDIIVGGTGEDSIQGGYGNDNIIGGEDADSIDGGAGSDTLLAGTGNDTVSDGFGADLVELGGGDDVFTNTGRGVPDQDTIYGGSGDDTILVAQSFDTVFGGGGDDVILSLNEGGLSFGDALLGGSGDDTITGANTNDTLDGGTGNDNLDGAGNTDTLTGGAGNDTLDGGIDDDILFGDFDGTGLSGTTNAFAYEFWDLSAVGAGLNSLADAGFDTFGDNRAAADSQGSTDTTNVTTIGTHHLGASPDFFAVKLTTTLTVTTGGTYTFDLTSDDGSKLFVNGAEIIDNDAVQGPITVSGSTSLGPGENLIEIIYFEKDIGQSLSLDVSGPDTAGSPIAIETANIGQSYNDTIDGGTGNDTIFGGDGNDRLDGGTGSDTLFGGAGNDRYATGAGDDTFFGGDGGDAVDLSDGFGSDAYFGGAGRNSINAFSLTAPATITYTTATGGTITSGGSTATFDEFYLFEAGFGAGGTLDASLSGTGVLYYDYGGSTTATGSDFDDSILAFGADPFGDNDRNYFGGAGNDSLDSADGNDTLLGGSGDDEIVARGGNDEVFGGTGNDSFFGGAGNDTLFGGVGNDTIDADTGVDEVFGGDGNDNITGLEGIFYGDAGDDVLDTSASTAAAYSGTLPYIYLYLGTGSDTVIGSDEVDEYVLIEGGTDTVDGGLDGGSEGDWLNFDLTGSAINVNLTSGVATYTGGSVAITDFEHIDTGDFDDLIIGSIEQNIIESGAGNDTIASGGGNDIVTGGAGNDTAFGGDGADNVSGGLGNDALDGGSGNDTIFGGDGDDILRSGQGDDTLDGGAGNDTLLNSAGDDTLIGGAGDDLLVATIGNDSLDGGAGNDTLMGGTDNDTLDGGADNDLLLGDLAGVRFNETSDDGVALASGITDFPATQLTVEITFASDDTTGFPTLFSYATSGEDDEFRVNAQSGFIRVELGGVTYNSSIPEADIFDGNIHTLAVTWNSATGAITLFVDGIAEDSGTFQSGATIDTGGTVALAQDQDSVGGGFQSGQVLDGTIYGVRLYDDLRTASEILDSALGPVADTSDTNLIANWVADPGAATFTDQTGTYAMIVSGDAAQASSAGDDTIMGDAGDDTLFGGGGVDDLFGGAGNDSIFGGAGNDSLGGGNGNDTLFGDEGDDFLEGIFGSNTLDGGVGNDTFYVSAAETGTDVTGGENTDDIDTMQVREAGGITTGATITYSGDEAGDGVFGTNTFSFREIEALDLSNNDDTVNATLDTVGVNIIARDGDDSVIGGSGNDTIAGDAGEDALFGGTGDDLLSGGGGNDTLEGGAGNDSLVGGDDADTFIVRDGFGTDTITGGDGGIDDDTIDLSNLTAPVTVAYASDAAGTITNGANTIDFSQIENLILTDQADTVNGASDGIGINIDAGAGNDTVNGGSGNDTLEGGAGDDRLIGEAGNDTINGGAGNDIVGGGVGDDVISGGDGDDGLFFGEGNDTVFGGAGDDRIDDEGGNPAYSGDNYLDGGSGNDTVFAGRGNDTLLGGEGDDFLSGQVDEDEIFGGAGNDSLQGGADNDTLFGGDGTDTLEGSSGNDTLSGGAGDDLLTGGSGDDIITTGTGEDFVVLTQGGGSDLVTDFDTADSDADGFYNDQLDVSDLRTLSGDPVRVGDVSVVDDGFGNAQLNFPEGETVTLQGVSPAQMDSNAELFAAGIPCFTSGTLIATPSGDIAVEDLKPGHLVQTREYGVQPILWAEHSNVGNGTQPLPLNAMPVRIKPGQFGNNRALIVSPQHCILLRNIEMEVDVFIRAKHLAEETDFASYARGKNCIRYHHLLLPRHASVISNAILSETFYPGPTAFAMLGSAAQLKLLGQLPSLGQEPVERAYGPRAASVLGRKAVRNAFGRGHLRTPRTAAMKSA